jgi:glycosyltransferase involved in cell wall biosynthesis
MWAPLLRLPQHGKERSLHLNEEDRHPDGMRHRGSSRELPREIVMVSNADWDHCLWTNNQHMAMGLATHGFRVLYVESLGLRKPTVKGRDLKRIVRRLIRGIQGLRMVRPGLWVFSPLVVPFHRYERVRRLNERLLGVSLRSMTKYLHFKDPILWTYNPLMFTLVKTLGASFLVYHCVDDLSAVPRTPTGALMQAEKSIASLADIIFTTSKRLLNRFSSLGSHSTYYFPNVADFEHFSKARAEGSIPDDLESIPTPRIGFVGAISSHKLDFNLIASVAERRPDWHWVLIGPWDTGEPERGRTPLEKPNVHLLGHREYHTLPDYLRGIDVAVLPCRINTYTRSMFPLKFFEYLAAGKPVVATPLEALEDYSGSFRTADSAERFHDAIDGILAGDRPDADFCLRLAQEHTWDKRLDSMLKVLENTWRSGSQNQFKYTEKNLDRTQ